LLSLVLLLLLLIIEDKPEELYENDFNSKDKFDIKEDTIYGLYEELYSAIRLIIKVNSNSVRNISALFLVIRFLTFLLLTKYRLKVFIRNKEN
jgi:hypothetical protein